MNSYLNNYREYVFLETSASTFSSQPKHERQTYPQGHWYPMTLSREVQSGRLYRIERLGNPYVVWRKKDGQVCALLDACPHRGAALSRGTLNGDHVECGYHGIQFDGKGTCKAIPLNGAATKLCASLHAQAISLREFQDMIWFWWGDARQVTDDPIPWFQFSTEGKSYVEVSRVSACNFYRLMEANLDFGHFYFVHKFMRTKQLGPYSAKFKAVTDGSHIRLTGHLGHEHPNHSMDEMVPVWAEVLFPNLSYYETPADLPQDRNPLVIFASPVNQQQTWFTLRIYLSKGKDTFFHKVYWRYFFLGFLFKIIHKQDLRLIQTQSSTLPEIHSDKLVCGADVGIAHYHRLVKKSLNSHFVNDPRVFESIEGETSFEPYEQTL